jgi:membrane protein DedA with SNARE-associated domain
MLEFISSSFNELLAIVDQTNPVYIYLILFGMAFLENIFPPLPGDTFTIIGGYLAAAGKLSLPMTLASVTLGTISSVLVVYCFGYCRGREYFARKRFRFFNAYDIRRVGQWFNRFGAWTVLFSRFIVGGRVAIALGAGMSKYPPVRMVIFSLISAMLFHGLLIALAYVMYAYITSLVEGFNLYSKIILVILAALVIIWIVFIIRRYKHGKKKA